MEGYDDTGPYARARTGQSHGQARAAVAWRMLRGEHENTDCDECKFPCEGCAKGGQQ